MQCSSGQRLPNSSFLKKKLSFLFLWVLSMEIGQWSQKHARQLFIQSFWSVLYDFNKISDVWLTQPTDTSHCSVFCLCRSNWTPQNVTRQGVMKMLSFLGGSPCNAPLHALAYKYRFRAGVCFSQAKIFQSRCDLNYTKPGSRFSCTNDELKNLCYASAFSRESSARPCQLVASVPVPLPHCDADKGPIQVSYTAVLRGLVCTVYGLFLAVLSERARLFLIVNIYFCPAAS